VAVLVGVGPDGFDGAADDEIRGVDLLLDGEGRHGGGARVRGGSDAERDDDREAVEKAHGLPRFPRRSERGYPIPAPPVKKAKG
jgi:hypothetical protein